MYFDKSYFDENSNAVEVDLICNRCGSTLILKNMTLFRNIQSDYCVSQKKIVCECGNVAEPGFIERKKNVTLKQATQINNNHQCNIPRCPTCGSINIKKITGLSKVGSVALWGVLSRKVHKQWHCNTCGSEW